jgi:hypothetical protein
MKTSYCLVAAAGLTAVIATVYTRLPLRAETPPATVPLPHEASMLAPAVVPAMPAVPQLPLPPIVPPPDGPLVIPAASATTPAPLPTLPSSPAPAALPPTPGLPTIPVAPGTAAPTPAPAAPLVQVPSTPSIPPAAPVVPKPAPIVPPAVSNPPAAPAPVPVKPTAPPEPKPLPLPAPTPFNPGLDRLAPEPAANLAPAGKLVVLKGNRLVEGTVKMQGETVVVRQGALDRSFPKADVLFIGGSKDEVYRFMLSKAPTEGVDGRMAVAKWCVLNGLREQALAEARAILTQHPTHRGAADLARSVEASLKQFPADGSRPRPEGALVTVEEPAPDVTAEAATSFASRAQPVLANQCMECHARDDHASPFRLKRVTGFEVGLQSTHANLRAVAGQLKKDDPANSPLLMKALTAHGGMKQPAFVSRQAVAFKVLESWVLAAVGTGTIPPMTAPEQPVFPAAPSVTPIPPATAAVSTSRTEVPDSKPILPPAEASTAPPVLPTPPGIPAAEPATRTSPSTLPVVPAIPPGEGIAKPGVAPPVIPALPQSGSVPKPAEPRKTAGTFGTASRPPALPGADEFDPAAFNRAVPQLPIDPSRK